MTFPDGTKYLGDWLNDKPHGQGTLSAVGKFEYAGEFANGVREGTGTLETADGKKYIGQWQNDVPHGQGKIIYPDGAVFVGQFENGRRNGLGEAVYTDGTKYDGQWQDDLPNGQGVKIYVDGEKYTGEFKNGLLHGQGTVVMPDGSSYTGQWQNDVLVRKEEVAAETELATVDENEGHVLAVVDDKSTAVPGAVATEPAIVPEPAASAENIVNSLAGYATVNQNGVFVRSGPSTEYRIIRSVSRGFPLQVMGQQDDWSNVKDFVGQQGWIYTPLLGLNNSAIVNVSKANVRSGPGLGFAMVGQVDFGTVLQIGNIKDDWYMATTPGGMKGWLHRDLIWPTGHAIVSGQDAPVEEAAGPQVAEPATQAAEPVIREQAAEPVSPAQQVVSAVAGEPVVDAPGPKGEQAQITGKAEGVDVTVITAPAENIPGPETLPAASGPAKEYAGVAQNGKGANIRSEPSLAAEVLRSVAPGFPMAVLERQGDWVLVEDFRARKGWVYASLLTDLQTVVIKVGKGNLRSGPGLTDEIIAKLDYGVVMFLDETRGDWLKVSNPEGLAGWLHRDVVWP